MNMELNTDNNNPSQNMNENAKWYIINVYSGMENSVVSEIKQKLHGRSFENHVEELIVPVKEVVQIKRGKKVKVKKNFLPGYVLIKAVLSENVLSLIRSIPKVSGFLGSKKNEGPPKAISMEEISNILQNIQASADNSEALVSQFEAGEMVTITEGPFATFSGVIESVDNEKQKAQLSVSIFDRLVSVELDFNQIEKEAR